MKMLKTAAAAGLGLVAGYLMAVFVLALAAPSVLSWLSAGSHDLGAEIRHNQSLWTEFLTDAGWLAGAYAIVCAAEWFRDQIGGYLKARPHLDR